MSSPVPLVQPLLEIIEERKVDLDVDMVERAFQYAERAHKDQKRKSGEPYVIHPVAVASILVELLENRATAPVLSAALLHDVAEDTESGVEDIRKEFGEEVAYLVDGVTKIAGLAFDSVESEQAENFRKMILSMSKDMRVILIKLADRLHNMRTLEHLSEKRRHAIAQETRDIYAPLAHRLGMGKLKWELEDLALKHLDNEEYKRIASLVDAKRPEREGLVESIIAPVKEALEIEGIPSEILGRAKHFDSIYRKMKVRHVPFNDMHDLIGVRIITETKTDCYRALGVLHDIYKPVPERFKDYIATPKTNLYQSLHTTVIGPDGRSVEFQIRTLEMHQIAEYGIAAHYTYKEGSKADNELNEKLGNLLSGTFELADDDDPDEYLNLLKTSLYQDEVFVFTPAGDLKRLAQGATALDFAFLVHTDVGLHTVGARANGKIVPLRYELKNGDVVEVITQPSAKPSEYWLSILNTSRARQKVRHWLKEQRREDSMNMGREMLIRELKRFRKKLPPDRKLIDAAQAVGVESVEMLFAAVGQGDLSAVHVSQKIFPELAESKKKKAPLAKTKEVSKRSTKGIQVQGVGNLMLRFSKCCQPIPGDHIVGVVTRGRGMSVHRMDCPNAFEEVVGPERRVDLSWDVPEDQEFVVKLIVTGDDRQGMLADIANGITSTGTNVIEAGMRGVDGQAEGTFLVEIRNLNQLTIVLSKIKKIKGVLDVERASLTGPE
ncbi:MAG: bifunctional (p)ppGpp synthetase/guanosine-3',5'-bis(diphosphate) 3'-pyrophosphohydrolase [Candidatus Eisenbacteria bacterium]|uniref:Bifunctional (P)ppGpp synthetase/guanosine-3',5'-bis(Diphosphate) 3'-pyrophosphohydrolase n=1 Tax=Eiseniibacteriota bacterium TaxID=2212470 RepID=A0A7Y2H4C2_UNCEI|nr:bifunctional (p)ppGpp synthetase/guanosine-3',5'-bis(diphosphate) 3'-pyrophosphohydrolase [Candidatus Eisenbacteria bacterium]